MFSKLKNKFETPLYAITQGLKTFTGVNVDGDLKGIDYKKIWSPDSEKIYGILPRRVWDDFHLTVMSINSPIPPHTDTEIVTTINFYIDTDGCETVFYDSKTDTPRSYQIENQTDGYIFLKEDLTPIASFVAQDNEIWVLDVKKIHSVESDKTDIKRKAVTLGTHIHDYEAVVAMLREVGSI
jgi:hypothetical protein